MQFPEDVLTMPRTATTTPHFQSSLSRQSSLKGLSDVGTDRDVEELRLDERSRSERGRFVEHGKESVQGGAGRAEGHGSESGEDAESSKLQRPLQPLPRRTIYPGMLLADSESPVEAINTSAPNLPGLTGNKEEIGRKVTIPLSPPVQDYSSRFFFFFL